jgi:hypothetical protein
MANITYNQIIRRLTLGFGNLFDDITLVRYNPDGTEAERFIVPIAYAAKELYVQRLQSDYNLDKKVQMTLPRMSFELTGMSYDASRKQNTNIKNFVNTDAGVKSQYNPVPYNFNYSLYLYTRNIEDAHQIIEHILPYFTPDYTIKINMVPELGIIKEVPILLNTTNFDITYEGLRDSDTRTIVWTLDFTVKGFIFGQTDTPKIIGTTITNILNDIDHHSDSVVLVLNMNNPGIGTYQEGELAYQGYTSTMPTASGTVVSWSPINSELTLKNIDGNFISSESIIGAKTNASYTFNSYKIMPVTNAQVIVFTEPTDARANGLYSYSTIINETPNTSNNVVNTNNFSGDLMVVLGRDDVSTETGITIDLSGN